MKVNKMDVKTGENMEKEIKTEFIFDYGMHVSKDGNEYRVMEPLSDTNLLLMDEQAGYFLVAFDVQAESHAKGEDIYPVRWEEGINLGMVPSMIDFRRIRQEYGKQQPLEELYDYRVFIKSKFYMLYNLSRDELAPEKIRKEAIQNLYEEYGTSREETFLDRYHDGGYDNGFYQKILEVKEKEKCR